MNLFGVVAVSGHIIMMSSIYLLYRSGVGSVSAAVFKSLSTTTAIYIHILARVGATRVPMATPRICLCIVLLNSKMLCPITIFKSFAMSSGGMGLTLICFR